MLLELGAAMCPLTGAAVPPSQATIRRVASAVDAQALEAVIAAWTAGQLSPAGDGKTVRGARVGGGAAPHLLSAATHDRSLVLTQRQVPSKTSEIPLVAVLLDDLRAAGHDLAAMVLTLDELHTPAHHRRPARQGRAGYVC